VCHTYHIFHLAYLNEVASIAPFTEKKGVGDIAQQDCEMQEPSLRENTRSSDVSAEGVW
jgi:hypothetical protein